VADGRVHQLVTWTIYKHTKTRTLAAASWKRMGAYNPDVPADLRKQIEAARVSPERSRLKKAALNEWLARWLEKHLSAAEREKFGDYARSRLRHGPKAASPQLLTKLKPVVGKTFADTAAFEAWLKAQQIRGAQADRVRRAAPARKPVATDTIVTFDAKTGRKLWQADFPGGVTWFGTSGTPCVKDGRLYATGAGAAYCLDAATGKTLWKVPVDAKPDNTSTCLYGSSSSAALRQIDGKARALAAYGGRLYSVEMKTGRTVWKAGGFRGMTTPAVRRDFMVCQGNIYGTRYGLIAYRLTSTGPRLLGKTDPTAQGRGASAVLLPGRAIAVGRGGTVGMAVPSGKAVFESSQPRRNLYSSPIFADGKLLIVAGARLKMFDVSDNDFYELASADLGLLKLTSPALVDGLLYVRAAKSVKCFDLRMPSKQELKAIHAWKRGLARKLCLDLDGDARRKAVAAARKLARLGPVGDEVFARQVKAAVTASDTGRLAILLEGAAGASYKVRSLLFDPLREYLRSSDAAGATSPPDAISCHLSRRSLGEGGCDDRLRLKSVRHTVRQNGESMDNVSSPPHGVGQAESEFLSLDGGKARLGRAGA